MIQGIGVAIKSFFALSPREKLGTVADILSILGISIFTLISAPVVSRLLGLNLTISDILIALFFWSLWCLCLGCVFYYCCRRIWLTAAQKRWLACSGNALLLVACLIAVIAPGPHLRIAAARVTENELFKPAQPATVATGFTNVTANFQEGTIKGKVVFNPQTKVSNYVVACYVYPDMNSRIVPHEIHSLELSESMFEIRKDNSFLVPRIVTKIDYSVPIQKFWIVLLRREDAGLLGSFPTLVEPPERALERFGPVVYELAAPNSAPESK